jgi:hypothetical protein
MYRCVRLHVHSCTMIDAPADKHVLDEAGVDGVCGWSPHFGGSTRCDGNSVSHSVSGRSWLSMENQLRLSFWMR